MTLGEKLDGLVERESWQALADLLAGLGDDELVAARTWYRKGRTKARRRAEPSVGGGDGAVACVQVLAVQLAPSATKAAAWFGWDSWNRSSEASERVVLRLLGSRGRDWCAEFVRAAGEQEFRPDRLHRSERIVRFCLPLLSYYDLPVPAGTAYGRGWPEYYLALGLGNRWTRSDSTGDSRRQFWLGDDEREPRTLLEALRGDPALAAGFSACLAVPGSLRRPPRSLEPDWELAPAVAALVAEQRLDRGRVIADCLNALTGPLPVHHQRVISKLLSAVELSAADLKGRVPLGQGLMATADGSVTAVLLMPLFEALSTATERDELAATVFARKEQKQQALLTKALAGLGVQPAEAESADLTGLWVDQLERLEPERVVAIQPGPQGLAGALSTLGLQDNPTDQALYLDAVVRWAAVDVAPVKSWIAANEPVEYREFFALARRWADGRLTQELFDAQYADAVRWHSNARIVFAPRHPEVTDSAAGGFAYLQAEESLLRAGRMPYLLSTPTFEDGVLAFDELVERLGGSAVCGPLDLFQALLRLEPVSVTRLAELPDQVVAVELPDGLGDAVSIVRRWIEGGGLPGPKVSVVDGTTEVELPPAPIDPAVFGGLAPAVLAGHDLGRRFAVNSIAMTESSCFGVLPHWPDLVAALLEHEFVPGGKSPTPWLWSMTSSRSDLAVHRLLAIGLTNRQQDKALIAVDSLVRLIRLGGFDPTHFTTSVLDLLARDSLPLAKIAGAFEQAALAGALSHLWPTATALVDQAAQTSPVGLANLLAFYRTYLPAVPDPVVPRSIHALAERKGSGKAVLEARALVKTVPVAP